MEQSLQWNSPLYLAFVDFAKAFDSVRRNIIWNEIEIGGITRYNYNNYKGNVIKLRMLCIT
jgi:hypothetical protein